MMGTDLMAKVVAVARADASGRCNRVLAKLKPGATVTRQVWDLQAYIAHDPMVESVLRAAPEAGQPGIEEAEVLAAYKAAYLARVVEMLGVRPAVQS